MRIALLLILTIFLGLEYKTFKPKMIHILFMDYIPISYHWYGMKVFR